MALLRWRVAALLIWLTFFFNIERIDLDGRNTIDLAPSIYMLAIAITLGALTTTLRRHPVWLLFVPSFVLYFGVLYIDRKPFFGDIQTYVTITGLGMLLVMVFLAYRVGEALDDFRNAVEDITFSDKGGRLKSLEVAQEAVQTEMIGSRRKQESMSLILLQADASTMNMSLHQLVQEIQRSMMQRYLLVTAARMLSKHLRRTDLLIEDSKPGRLILVAPDTAQEKAPALGQRMVGILQERMGISATFGIASFPQQALTFEELLNTAEQNLGETPVLEADAALEQNILELNQPTAQRAESSATERTVGEH